LNRKTKKLACASLALFSLLLLTPGCQDMPPNLVYSPADISGRVIGALIGTPSERLADELGKKRAFTSGDDMIANLRAGVIDCAIMENSAAAELTAESTEVRIISEPLVEYELHYAVAKENAELLLAIDSAINALKQNGTLNGLCGKYFADKSYSYATPEGVDIHPGKLSVAAPPDSRPFSYKTSDGEYSGLDIEVTRAVCDMLGVEFSIIECDSWELVNAVWYGMADLAVGWMPGEGDDLVSVSDAYANAVHVVIVRR